MSLEETLRMGTNTVEVVDCGRMNYLEALALQQKLREQRIREEIKDTVLLVEHDPVYTLGKDQIDEQNLIKSPLPAPLIKVDRGGKITYHGPGQLVAYFLFKLPLSELGNFVTGIENLTLETLRSYGLPAYSRKEEKDSYGKNIRGAWCKYRGEHKKVAAQGLELKKAGEDPKSGEQLVVTMHGFALNVNTDLSYFRPIRPCGFDYEVTSSMQEISGSTLDFEEVKKKVGNKIRIWRSG